jgi:sulfur relay (sulfurtransferase) DsrF/TusC family protein
LKAIRFEQEKVTKNTVRFTEVLDEMDTPAIGTLYVQKHALKEIGYKEGQQLNVVLEVVDESNQNNN